MRVTHLRVQNQKHRCTFQPRLNTDTTTIDHQMCNARALNIINHVKDMGRDKCVRHPKITWQVLGNVARVLKGHSDMDGRFFVRKHRKQGYSQGWTGHSMIVFLCSFLIVFFGMWINLDYDGVIILCMD